MFAEAHLKSKYKSETGGKKMDIEVFILKVETMKQKPINILESADDMEARLFNSIPAIILLPVLVEK